MTACRAQFVSDGKTKNFLEIPNDFRSVFVGIVFRVQQKQRLVQILLLDDELYFPPQTFRVVDANHDRDRVLHQIAITWSANRCVEGTRERHRREGRHRLDCPSATTGPRLVPSSSKSSSSDLFRSAIIDTTERQSRPLAVATQRYRRGTNAETAPAAEGRSPAPAQAIRAGIGARPEGCGRRRRGTSASPDKEVPR